MKRAHKREETHVVHCPTMWFNYLPSAFQPPPPSPVAAHQGFLPDRRRPRVQRREADAELLGRGVKKVRWISCVEPTTLTVTLVNANQKDGKNTDEKRTRSEQWYRNGRTSARTSIEHPQKSLLRYVKICYISHAPPLFCQEHHSALMNLGPNHSLLWCLHERLARACMKGSLARRAGRRRSRGSRTNLAAVGRQSAAGGVALPSGRRL